MRYHNGNRLLVGLVGCTAITAVVAASADDSFSSVQKLVAPMLSAQPALAVKPAGADTAEEAARQMVRAIARRDYRAFLLYRALGVCEGQHEWPNRWAQCLHSTRFTDDTAEQTIFEMRRLLKPDTIRVASVRPLQVSGGVTLSAYYASKFACVDLTIENSDGRVWHTRIVVGQVGEKWFGIPRRVRSPIYQQARESFGAVQGGQQ